MWLQQINFRIIAKTVISLKEENLGLFQINIKIIISMLLNKMYQNPKFNQMTIY